MPAKPTAVYRTPCANIPKEELEKRMGVFLAELELSGRMATSAKRAGLATSTLYLQRDRNPVFATEWEAALERYTDRLEEEAERRAVRGTDRGVWHQGALVGKETEYSDKLLSEMLKAKRAAYRTNAIELTGKDGGPINASLDLTVQFLTPDMVKKGEDLA